MFTKTLPLIALAGVAHSHMSMFYPAPLGAAPSINKQSTTLDKEFNYPLGCCGSSGGPTEPSPGLCRGHLDKFDTETAVVTWQPGQDAYFQLTDYSYDPNAPGGTHSGGSCQVGFSVDKGATWKVAASYHGACPYETTDGSPEAQTFDFKVPTGMPEGDALFAWVWLNREHESFMNCAKVNIGGGSGNSTSPSYPAQSSTAPKPPTQSGTTPQPPAQSGTKPKPPTPSSQPEEPEYPAPTSHAGHHHHSHHHYTPTATGRHSRPTPTQAPDYADDNSDDSDNNDDNNNDDSSDDSDDSNEKRDSSWLHRPHRDVKQNTRRYNVDGTMCDCRRDEFTLGVRCACNASEEKRSEVERKARHLHRRTFYKRVDACNWASAPAMEVSYYTEDAKCAPNAKINTPESDDFELKWDVSCGVVEGKTDYKLQTMNCGMYGAK